MQTVKINTFDNTIIFECDSITLAKRHQRMCECALNDAKLKGVDDPSYMIVTGGVIELEDGSFKDNSEIDVISHYQSKDTEIIGVICMPVEDKDVINYQFIFKGESVYVMNENGKTIEVLK